MKTSKKSKEDNITEDKYTKNQIVNSKTFKDSKDLLNAILKEDKNYTKGEIIEIIKNYKEGKVK